MLSLGIRAVHEAGGEVAYLDTDSLVVVSSQRGGFVRCEGGPYRLDDGNRAVLALSWDEVERIRDRFSALNPYDRLSIPGSILKLENENFVDEVREERCELWCHAVGEKSYALFTFDAMGEPNIKKYSSHVLGQLRSPIEGDCHGWIIETWKREIRRVLGFQTAPFEWEQYPAISQLTLSTWTVMKPYLSNKNLRPFDFLAVGMISRNLADIALRPHVCCEEPRPACPLFKNLAAWRSQDWRCLHCGTRWDFEKFPPLRTYSDVIRSTLRGSRKRLNADGSESKRGVLRGLTIPRPVHVESMTRIGKEVIVDPTDTDEGLTAELLSATSILEYRDPGEELDELRAAIKGFGISLVARGSEVSRATVKAFVNQRTIPHSSTLQRIKSLLYDKLPPKSGWGWGYRGARKRAR